MSNAVEEFPVVVVGGGPGGLASGVTLGSYGVETLVVERREATSVLPRATVASTATMELLRRWGLEDKAHERALDVEWKAWACGTLARAAEGSPIEVGLPTREQAALISPTAPACLAQDELEPLLEECLRSFASTRLERGVEVVALDPQRDGGYLLTVSGPDGRRRVRARHVIGADGLRSTVRSELGIAAAGSEGVADRLAVLFRAPVWHRVGEHRYGIYFITDEPEGRSLLPVGRPGRWLFARAWDPADDVDAVPLEETKLWIRDAVGDPGLPIEIDRMMPVTFGIALAEHFRAGDAFLIGDAAHRVTPRGGTGLNTAIHDGFDIAWKLAWVLRGWAGDALLDSYERERRPVAEFNAERSMRWDGSLLGTTFGLNADIGGRIAHVWVPRDDDLVSTLDLLGDGLTLFTGPDWAGSEPSDRYGLPPVTVERLDAISARALGLTASGCLLARPDGVPVSLRNDATVDPARRYREPDANRDLERQLAQAAAATAVAVVG